MMFKFALLFLLIGCTAVSSQQSCANSIPGVWQSGGNNYTTTWAPARPYFEALWPAAASSLGADKAWRTCNATFSADYRTVIANFSNGHIGVGKVSFLCDTFNWDDGTIWVAMIPIPTIHVHIVPHTHDDVGWDETYMQYFDGNGPLGTGRNVTKILTNVITGLIADPRRRFSYVEQAYFQIFYETRTPAMQATIRGLVANKQLVFINGGWSMHDESSPSYIDMLDNTAVGHRAISEAFGIEALPRVTWQIDPFGHSAFQGVLSSSLAGSQGVMWGREPADFKIASEYNRAIERVWLPSVSLGASAAAFGAVFYDKGYSSPSWNACGSNSNVTICSHARGFADATVAANEIYSSRIRAVRGNDVQILFGSDFTWENAVLDPSNPSSGAWFNYVDGIIDGLNADPEKRFIASYSTPADYIAAKLSSNLTLPALTQDLFPYNDDTAGHNMWSGYFTSRPAFKGYVRETSAVLQSARQLQALVGGIADTGPTNPLFALERAMGVSQHHDSVSGTARENVNKDYAARLSVGRADAFVAIGEAFAASSGYTGEAFAPCELANVTLCAALEAGNAAVVFIYNALGQALPAAPIRLSVGLPNGVESYAVVDANGANVTAQLVPLSTRDTALRALYNATPNAPVAWLCFEGALPAAGYSAFFLSPRANAAEAPHTHASHVELMRVDDGDATVTNGRITLTIAAATGFMSTYNDNATGVMLPLTQSWAAYEGFNGSYNMDGTNQPSGAYIFRPARAIPDAIAAEPATVNLISGPIVSEARSELGYISQSTRLWASASSVEIEWVVGPVDVVRNTSREVITRYTSPLASAGAWRSDSNCRESQLRQRNFRGNWTVNISEPVSANYVPTNCIASLSSATMMLAVAVDRSEGGTSLTDGELEFMVHRRMLHDDRRGVSEPLNEPGVDGRGLIVRGKHWLVVAPVATAARAAKALSQQALSAPTTVRGIAGLDLDPLRWLSDYRGRASLLQASLPENVHLATVHVLNVTSWLVRLAHLYEVGEDAILSLQARVDLATLFTSCTVVGAVDMTLPGAQRLADVPKTTFLTEGGLVATVPILPIPAQGLNLTIFIAPMEIRTFILTIV